MPKLAINGGNKIVNIPFPDQYTTGLSEREAVWEHMHSGKSLSNYRGNWIKEFWGGDKVRKFEQEFAEKFNVKYAVAVNSCTSALQLACIAAGLEKGDEVIVTPWSMSCSATAPLICGAIPVFADIGRDDFCLDYNSVKSKITEKTKAIIVVDLFGQRYKYELDNLARKHNLIIIEDAAQAIGSKRGALYAGGIGDIGCFSFTQGKHLTCGEGGMLVTDDYETAFKAALLRNHSEAVVSANDKNRLFVDKYSKFFGFNLRMTELQAVIMSEQLKRLEGYIYDRVENSRSISEKLCAFPFISKPVINKECTNSYYVDPYYFDQSKLLSNGSATRDMFIAAVKAELMGEKSRPDRPMLGCGYIKPLYRMPIFAKNYGDDDNLKFSDSDYERTFPNVEKLWKKDFFLSLYHSLPLEFNDINNIVNAFEKVYSNLGELVDTKQPNGWHLSQLS